MISQENRTAFPQDRTEREQALDPGGSFIVQAPAGSGKTGLLVQRYLRLLSLVQAPEEILAITFTRKAASEMRNRILSSFQRVQQGEVPDDPHAGAIHALAAKALERNTRMGWHLEDNPSRLKIQTIDSLCASLVGQMPLLSKLGAGTTINDHPEDLYQEAARRTVAELETGEGWSNAVFSLISYLDNDLERVAGLIAGMLAKREQWLRHLADRQDLRLQRKVLEQGFAQVLQKGLERVKMEFDRVEFEPILELARFAGSQLQYGQQESLIGELAVLTRMPGTHASDLVFWQGLAELFLTRQGTWRRRPDRNTGFPAPGSTRNKGEKELFKRKKEDFLGIVADLSQRPGVRRALDEVRRLPPPDYSEEQWSILGSLFEILPLAVAHLHLVFQTENQVDFAEISMRALQALGTPDDPTDLGLAWDVRLQHILMDEFQDTNQSQFSLLKQLTAGWQEGDGRSFFAVGDPMQSIYLFREAEVGLFLQARRYGLGDLQPTPLQLQVNFRSEQQIVDWVNQTFAQVLPEQESIISGGVPYACSRPWQPADPENSVEIHPFFGPDPEPEAQRVLELINRERSRDAAASIGVLVRSRSHLRSILPVLKDHGVLFQAVDIEALAERPVVQDLLALTKALVFPGHRPAWLAVLRAGWCGLCLSDLEILVGGGDFERPVLSCLFDQARCVRLSPEGEQRVLRVRDILARGVASRSRGSLWTQVESVWLALGGPATVSREQDLEDARVFFELLSRRFSWLDPFEPSALDQALAELFAQPTATAEDSVQIMTIHRAKGLEFDTVVLPGLGRTWPADPHQLLLWQELPREGGSDLLLAPMAEAGEDQGRGYLYLKGLKKQKAEHEEERIMYVAATRAMRRLHLLGHVTVEDKSDRLREPATNSPLSFLWPAVKDAFVQAHERRGEEDAGETPRMSEGGAQGRKLFRLSADWTLPSPPRGIDPEQGQEGGFDPGAEEEPVEYFWVGRLLPRVGTLVHAWLLRLAREGSAGWLEQKRRERKAVFQQQLLSLGVSGEEAGQGGAMVLEALEKTLADPRGCWILRDHEDARSEYALTALVQGGRQSVVLDRTFVDETGVRWIIDYKTSTHSGQDRDRFLDREKQRYRQQMEDYARVMRCREKRPVRLGLYFPLLQGWREWG